MRSIVATLLSVLSLLTFAEGARADVGWSEDQYNQTFGQGQRGFGTTNERAYKIGENILVVEYSSDNTHSVGELWVLGVVRDNVPDKVKKAADLASKGPEIERVEFKAKSSIPAEIHEAVVDGVVVRVDIRNQLISRIAFCGKKPECSWWDRLFGPPCETTLPCPVLQRALGVDHTMDSMHERAEEAVQRMQGH